MDKIIGSVNRVVYYNEDNGYGIIKLKLDFKNSINAQYQNKLFSNLISVLSTFDRKPLEDEEYEFDGEIEQSSYGMQLKAKSFRRINETSKDGIVTYLSSELFPQVGKRAATKVFEVLGENALQKIIDDRGCLDDVDITNKQKDSIYENLVIHYSKEKSLVDLLNLGLSMKLSVKIINVLGDQAVFKVKKNPYQLIDLIEGIAFVRADDIANKLGIKKDADIRLYALINYILKSLVYSTGDTYYPMDELREKVNEYALSQDIIIEKNKFDELIKQLKNDKKIVIEDNNVFEYHLYYDEINLAKNISSFLNNTKLDYSKKKVDSVIEEVMNNNNIVYSSKQLEAIKTALLEPVTIITGGPGTGKSTIIKGLVEAYAGLFKKSDLIKNQIYLLAPTGRASKRLKEVTLHPNASTIHKFLGYQGNGYFGALSDGPIDAKMIIIDEFSMVDISLASILFKCIAPNTKIVIVGDVDQLPAVGAGDVLRDLIDSKEIATIKLDKIHRQAADSTIVQFAHEINEGYLSYNVIEKQHDRNFIPCDDSRIIEIIKQIVEQGVSTKMDLIKDIQVLVPLYRGVVGIDAINYSLQDAFNKESKQVIYNGRRFRENDKVIQLVNRQEKQVMNGDIGYIRHIDIENESLKGLDVMFEFGSVHYEKDEIEDLNLAYAISIHKAQGSEFKLVIVPFSFKYYIMLKRKLIYTAVTRAKEYLIMLGNIEALRKGITQIEEKRKTKLQERLHEIIANPNIIYDEESAFKEVFDVDDVSISDFEDKEMVDLSEMENISIDDFSNQDAYDSNKMENITPYDFIEKSK